MATLLAALPRQSDRPARDAWHSCPARRPHSLITHSGRYSTAGRVQCHPQGIPEPAENSATKFRSGPAQRTTRDGRARLRQLGGQLANLSDRLRQLALRPDLVAGGPQHALRRAHLDRDPRERIEHRRTQPREARLRERRRPGRQRLAPLAALAAASSYDLVSRYSVLTRASHGSVPRSQSLAAEVSWSRLVNPSSVRSITQRSPGLQPTSVKITGRATGVVSSRRLASPKLPQVSNTSRSRWSGGICRMPRCATR